jgi:SET domain-containing protein
LCCSFKANGDIRYESIGKAVFPFASLLNHSCAPNVARIDVESKMYLVLKRPIKAGEQLFDSYG